MKFFAKLMSLLLFIVALLYIAGLVFCIFFKSSAPSDLHLFYPYLFILRV